MGVSLVVCREQRDCHLCDRDRLIPIIGHHEKNRQVSVPGEVDGENLGLLLRIVRIRSDSDLLISMQIVRWIVDGSLCRRLDEGLAREHNRHQHSKANDNHKPATAAVAIEAFAFRNYRGAGCGTCGLEWLSLSYFLYSVVLALALVLSLPYWLYHMARYGKYWRGFAERMGRVPASLTLAPAAPRIWIHAVSVGEVLAVAALVPEMRRTFPRHRVVVSSTTDTGHALAQKRFGAENAFYLPDGLCICDPAISPCASSGAGNARRNGILAEFLAYRPRQRSTNCGCERAYLGPLMAELSALRAASAQNSGQRRSVPGANAT